MHKNQYHSDHKHNAQKVLRFSRAKCKMSSAEKRELYNKATKQ